VTMLLTTPLSQVEERHLADLIENRIQETRDIEFKRDAIGTDDRAKKEFLKDVTSFANTAGGHLVVGIEESDGVASALHGITVRPADQEIRRLDSILESGIEPRLVGVRIHSVSINTGGYALVLQIPASWNPPHRVAFDRTNRFYARNSAGAYELSVEQLRSAFLGGAEAERRLMEFRVQRLARLEGGVRGPGVSGRGTLIVQLIPLTHSVDSFDLSSIERNLGNYVPPGLSGNITYRFNFDGFLLHEATTDSDFPKSYTQVFRDGRIEIAVGWHVYEHQPVGSKMLMTAGRTLSWNLAKAAEISVLGALRIGATPPFALMSSFIGGAGSVLALSDFGFSGFRKPLDRDALLFDPVIVESSAMTDGWQTLLRPIYDSLWNAFGNSRCDALFDSAGNWSGFPPNWRS
jgi:hypothetical protein